MANGGFMAGGFAQGLTSGLQAGTAALAPGRDLALRQAEREAETAEQRRTELIGQIKELDTGFAKVVGERGPEAGQRLLDSLRAPSITIGDQKLSQLDLLAMQVQQAGVEMVTSEILESRLASHLAGGLTAEEQGGLAAGKTRAELTEGLGREPTGEEMAQKLGVAQDPGAMVDKFSRLAVTLLEAGTDPNAVRQVLDQAAASTQNVQARSALTALSDSLPESIEAYQTAKTGAEVAAAMPRIRALVQAGVPEDWATILSIGGRGATIALPASPTKLGEGELRDIRTEIADAESVTRALDQILPIINEDTVGLLPSFSESTGGLIQNIPLVRDVFNAVGKPLGLDIGSVRTAQEARSVFRQQIGVLTRFISEKGGRLSNQDREFALEAIRVLNETSEVSAARKALLTLRDTAQRVAEMNRQRLVTGDVGGPQQAPGTGTFRGEFDDKGNLVFKDASGNIVRTIEKVQ